MDAFARLRADLGNPRPPAAITPQGPDYHARHYRRLARLPPDARAEPDDLWAYAHDVCYESAGRVQRSLLLWTLPFCLRAWREELLGIDSRYGGFVEYLYTAFAGSPVLGEVLDDGEAAAVSAFMRSAILEEIDAQQGLSFAGTGARPYRWVRALTTYGVIFPDLEALWTAWWGLETRGRAVSAIQYLSCLVFRDDENPVFAPWCPAGGGGPPCLWEFEGYLYTLRWLEPNVCFLRVALTVSRVTDILRTAVTRVAAEPAAEAGARVLAGIAGREAVLAGRCAELPVILERRQQPHVLPAWSL